MSDQNTHATVTEDSQFTTADIGMDDPQIGETQVTAPQPTLIAWVELPDAASMRAHIFSTPDIKEEVVAVQEWKVKILVRGLNAKTRSQLLQRSLKKDGTPDLEKMYPDLVIATARHPLDGTLLFSPADRDALNEKSGGVLEFLAMTAARLSGLDTASQEAAATNFRT